MDSRISRAIRQKYPPIALLWAEEKPKDAIEFVPGRWGCSISLFAQAAVHGKTAAISRETVGCSGGAVGLGFGNRYEQALGGIECFYRFLSTGNRGVPEFEEAVERSGRPLQARIQESFLEGERYMKTPELAKDFVQGLPMRDIPAPYVIMKPLEQVRGDSEKPVSVTYLVNPDQLAALVVLANYGRPGNENVICPQAAGCQSLGIIPYQEAEREKPRAVIGLFDITARLIVAGILEPELLTFTIPVKMFREMEADVPGSFLEMDSWRELLEKRERTGRV